MKNALTIVILLGITVVLSLYACTEDRDLPRKSFVVVDNVQSFIFSKTEVLITFNISKVEEVDPIVSRYIEFYQVQNPSVITRGAIDINKNSIRIDTLTKETEYAYTIYVMTSDAPPNTYASELHFFTTPGITVITDSLVSELDKELKLTAFGLIQEFEVADLAAIDSVGHYWIHNGDTIITSVSAQEISPEGLFRSEFQYFDFTKKYDVKAYVKQTGKSVVLDGAVPAVSYRSLSKGDFWVDIDKLAKPQDRYSGSPREGAVSFVINGIAYVGLGRSEVGTYLLDFWKYDPHRNKWGKLPGSFPSGKGRMHAVAFHDNVGNVYVGTGCNPCQDDAASIEKIGFKSDFYRFDPQSESWTEITNLSLTHGSDESNNSHKDDDKDGKERLDAGDCINSADCEETDDEGRFGAYVFSDGMSIYIGGGLGKTIREGDLNEDNQINDLEWQDLNGNGVLDLKEWVDADDNDTINIGDWTDFNSNDIIDSGELDNTDGNEYVDAGEWTDSLDSDGEVDGVEWVDNNANRFIDAGEWHDFNRNKHRDNFDLDESEWIDTDGDGLVDDEEVTYKLYARNDLWKVNLNNLTTGNWEHVSDNEDHTRYGATALNWNGDAYLFMGDTYPASPPGTEGSILKFNGNGWTSPTSNNIPETRVYAPTFVIPQYNQLYLGAGEYNDSTLVSFDMWGINSSLLGKEVSACGLLGLSRGIGFGIEDKGYVGFGRSNTGIGVEVGKEFWVYIPCLKNCN